MTSRARIFAAVTLLFSCLASPAVWAQAQNLEAGKSPSQLFAGTCTACHKSPRGLLKTVSPDSLSGFLREHYTTSGDMASQLATYLISNGASDSRQSKQGADKQGQGGNDQADHQGRKNRNAPAQEAARPDDAPPAGEGGRQGRKRQAHPGEASEENRPVANAPAQADTERGPEGRKPSARQRSKLGKPSVVEEPSMANEPPKAEAAKVESGAEDKPKAEPRQEMGNTAVKPDAGSKPSDQAKPEPAKSEAAKIETPTDGVADKPVVRRDPVPPVTAAPPTAASSPASAPAAAQAAPVASGAGTSEQAASQPQPKAASGSPPPASPVPSGPPAPPISQ